MVFNRFRLQVIIRTILIGVSIYISIFLINKEYHVTALFALFFSALQLYLLIYFVEKTNRDLARFFNAIKFSDYSQSFGKNLPGGSFTELHKSFGNVIEQFRKTRSEMEEHFQYLQTVVKHVKIGLLSYRQDGEIEIMNDPARQLLQAGEIININQLQRTDLLNTLNNIRPGERSLVKIQNNNQQLQLSISSSEFKMRGRKYKLVSLQDISNELERERLTSELEIAHEVQMKLLPKSSPVAANYTICGKCISAKETGGDYYDFIQLNNDELGIVIADVAGKGLPAAIYMTLTKGVFQSFAAGSDSPKDVLIKMNSLIYQTIERGRFITMFYGILNYKTHTFRYARAGHEPAILLNRLSRKYLLLKPNGIGLGLDKGSIFNESIEESQITLAPDDAVFFYTDGLPDAKNEENIPFGMDRLQSMLMNNDGTLFADKILNELLEYQKAVPQYDDITFIFLKHNT